MSDWKLIEWCVSYFTMFWNFTYSRGCIHTEEIKNYQRIVRLGQITVARRPIDIRISADHSIFENGTQKIDCYVGCVASGPVLLKPNVVHVTLFNFWIQKFVEHGTVTLAIDRNGGFLLIVEEKWPNDANVSKSALNSHSLWVHRFLNDDIWIF